MKYQIFCAFFFLLVFVSCIAAASRDYDYSNGTSGPQRWGSLHSEWSVCSSGSNQSPINLTKEAVVRDKTLHRLHPSYEGSATAAKLDWDNDIALAFSTDPGSVIINGSQYQLFQVRLHSPSEHTVDGKEFPAELHLLHNSTDGSNRTAIIAFFFKLGRANEFIDQVLTIVTSSSSSSNSSSDASSDDLALDPTLLKMAGRSYYKYSGSFTNPPCTESVDWYLIKKNRRLSLEQFNSIQNIVTGNNARPLQPVNGRTIQSYK